MAFDRDPFPPGTVLGGERRRFFGRELSQIPKKDESATTGTLVRGSARRHAWRTVFSL
jgi:hypothetical protein